MNFSSLQQKGTWVSRRGCQMLELGAVVPRLSPPVICLSLQPQTYSSRSRPRAPGLGLGKLHISSASRLSAPIGSLRSQGKENGRGDFLLAYSFPSLSQLQGRSFVPSGWQAAVRSCFQLLSKLASSHWPLPSLEAGGFRLRSPFSKRLPLNRASPSATPWHKGSHRCLAFGIFFYFSATQRLLTFL